ncbi:hypothetical protein GGS21DRAFT_335212 [Xylaria nigripes]|nr:hypothetical protein GGS21DRAFT_335212 [Xylaria nigripes]
MRLNVGILELWACFIGVSTASSLLETCKISQYDLYPDTIPNEVVSVESPVFSTDPVSISPDTNSTFMFNPIKVNIGEIRLKLYDTNWVHDGSHDEVIAHTGLGDETISPGTVGRNAPVSQRDGDSLPRPGIGEDPLQSDPEYNDSVAIVWSKFSQEYIGMPLYLECDWKNETTRGTSTTPLFIILCDRQANVPQSNPSGTIIPSNEQPARGEIVRTAELSTPGSSQTITTLLKASQTAPSPLPEGSPEKGGLSKGGIIGIALGSTVAGLLVISALIFLLIRQRQRRANLAHHTMASTDSDVGAHTMKDPMAAESTAPDSRDGGEVTAAVASPYAPYSDRTATPSQHTTADTEPATSRTELTGSRDVLTTAPFRASTYSHLIEEGMSEEEIQRLEEEERQLDAAIEDAGRRGKAMSIDGEDSYTLS